MAKTFLQVRTDERDKEQASVILEQLGTNLSSVVNMLLKQIEAAGLRIAGRSGDDQLVEIIEVPNHPWFVACQFHPEFTSTPRDGHPLFAGFVKAASEHQKRQAK